MKHTIIPNNNHILEFSSINCEMKITLTSDEFNELVEHIKAWIMTGTELTLTENPTNHDTTDKN